MTTWNADSLLQPLGAVEPSTQDIADMLQELYDEWVPAVIGDTDALHRWAVARFGTTMEQITADTLKQGVSRRINQLKRLFELIKKKRRAQAQNFANSNDTMFRVDDNDDLYS